MNFKILFLYSFKCGSLKLVVLLVAAFINYNATGQFLGVPQLTTYPIEEYGAGGQNYQIKISSEGVVYVANNFGLLRFDGSRWRRSEIPGGTKIRSILLDEDRIYVGAQNELGYFVESLSGELIYTSLREKIPELEQGFEDVWKIIPSNEGISFTTTGRSFIYTEDAFQVVQSSAAPGFVSSVNDTLITQSPTGHLQAFYQGKWNDYMKQPFQESESLVTTLVLDDQTKLWFTRKSGILKTVGPSSEAFASAYTGLLSEAIITTAVRLGAGQIAVGTQSAGLFIFDTGGDLVFHFNKDRGFNSLTVNDITEDQNGSLWVSVSNRILKIHWNYPISFIDEKLDVPGTGYSAAEYKDQFYFGTNNGLYRAEKVGAMLGKAEGFNDLKGQINNVQIVDESLLVSADDGMYFESGGRMVSIDQSVGWWIMIPTSSPGKFIGGSYAGLGLFTNQENQWKLEKKYEGFDESSRVMIFDSKGFLWMTHGYKGIYRLRFSEEYDHLQDVRYYGVEQGLPSLYLNNVFEVGDELVFGTESGLFQFDYEDELFTRHPYFDTLVGPHLHTRIIKETPKGDIYILTNDYFGLLKKDQWTGYQLEKNLFNAIFPLLNNDLAQICILGNNQLLFTANQGFIHFNEEIEHQAQKPSTKMTKIEILNSEDNILDFSEPGDSKLNLSYNSNALTFYYTSLKDPFDKPTYSYRLIGFRDEGWSEWTGQNSKEYTNLFEGSYEFEVKSRDIFLNESDAVAFKFRIYPPWYRSTLAYIGYIFLFISTFFISFYAYRRRYKKEKIKLIADQKKEIEIKETELTQLKNEKLESEISHKKRQLASSTMHLLDKNDLLSRLKTQINTLTDNEQLDQQSVKDLRRMVKEIDRNIDKDKSWEQFELHFDEVHGDFLKRISHEYDSMTPQEIKLAAYLRMNMTTKEIANLLKISVRGVEIARYRLRKKLDLNQGQNLVDFMLKY